jgi:hypothetical protein
MEDFDDGWPGYEEPVIRYESRMERSKEGRQRHVQIGTEATRATNHHALFCSKGVRERHQPRNGDISTGFKS